MIWVLCIYAGLFLGSCAMLAITDDLLAWSMRSDRG